MTVLAAAAHRGYEIEREAGCLRCSFPEGATPDALEAFFDAMARLDAGAQRLAPLLFLGHAAPVLTSDARRVIYRRHGELGARRIAVLGAHAAAAFIVNFLVLATGRKHVRFFTDESDARSWLEDET